MKIQTTMIKRPVMPAKKAPVSTPEADAEKDQVTFGERALGATYYASAGVAAGGFLAAVLTVGGGFAEMYSGLVGGEHVATTLGFALPMTLLGAAGAVYGGVRGLELG